MKSYSFTKVSGDKHDRLLKQFPFLADLIRSQFRITTDRVTFDNSQSQLDYRFVSVFDHQLDHDESDQLLGNTSTEQNSTWNRSHELHIRSLYGHSYFARLKGRRKEKLEILIPSTKGIFLEMAWDLIFYPKGAHIENYIMIIPEFSVVYHPCYDYTNLALITEPNKSNAFFDNLLDHKLHSYK